MCATEEGQCNNTGGKKIVLYHFQSTVVSTSSCVTGCDQIENATCVAYAREMLTEFGWKP